MAQTTPRIELHMDDLARLVERARQGPLSDDDYRTLKAAIDTLGQVAHLLDDKNASIRRLRQMLFGASTEKTADVLARAESSGGPSSGTKTDAGSDRRHPSVRHQGMAETAPTRTRALSGSPYRMPACVTATAVRTV